MGSSVPVAPRQARAFIFGARTIKLMKTPSPLAGWYPNPAQPDVERYWDGNVWTGETRSLEPATAHTSEIQPAAPRSFVAEPVDFLTAVQRGFTVWNLKGRASRSEFWYWLLGSILIGTFSNLLIAGIGSTSDGDLDSRWSALSRLISITCAVITIKVSVRRLHDIGKGGAWLLMMLGIMALTWVLVLGGSITDLNGMTRVFSIRVGEGAAGSGSSPLGAGNGFLEVFGSVVVRPAVFIWYIVWLCTRGNPERNEYDD